MYGGHTSLILLDESRTYAKLVDIVILELGIGYVGMVTVSLNSTLPLVRIFSDSNVLSYLGLKSIDAHPLSYPINVEVLPTYPWQSRCILPRPKSSTNNRDLRLIVFFATNTL